MMNIGKEMAGGKVVWKGCSLDCVYAYMDRLSDMLENDNSYIRTRGLMLIAYNASYKDIQKALKEIQKL